MLEDFGVGAVSAQTLGDKDKLCFFFLVSLLSLHNFTISIYQYFFTQTLHLILHSWEPRVSHPSRPASTKPSAGHARKGTITRGPPGEGWEACRFYGKTWKTKDLMEKLCVMVSGCIMMYHHGIIRSNLEWFGLLTEMESTILWWYKTGWRKTAGKTHECLQFQYDISLSLRLFSYG